jgi:GSH-dependent disulfide-bond oxidoreductase
MIDLYFWPTPNGQKITIALEEMGLAYTIKPVNIGKGDQFAPDFLKIAPNNRMPAIVDHAPTDQGADGGDAISVFESGAILQYLSEKTGQFGGTDLRSRSRVTEWLMWQMGGLGPMLGQNGHFKRYAPEKVQYGIDRYHAESLRLFRVLDTQLAAMSDLGANQGGYVAGDYSVADIAIYPWAATHELQETPIDDRPHLLAWLERMAARPGVTAGMAAGAELRANAAPMTDEEKALLFGHKKG